MVDDLFSPFGDFRRLREEIDRLFKEFARPFYGSGQPLLGSGASGQPLLGSGASGESLATVVPYTDIVERENEIIITTDVPGVNKEDIEINIGEDNVEIKAEKKEETKKEEEGYIQRERYYSRYYKSIPLPDAVDAEKSEASFKNGVLEIKMPKIEGTEKKKKLLVK